MNRKDSYFHRLGISSAEFYRTDWGRVSVQVRLVLFGLAADRRSSRLYCNMEDIFSFLWLTELCIFASTRVSHAR